LVEREVVDPEELCPAIPRDGEALFVSDLEGDEATSGGQGGDRLLDVSLRVRGRGGEDLDVDSRHANG
jgi:hypothetical protein